MAETFVTANVKLEQFLFIHDIKFISFHKNDDMMTEWVYAKTPELEETVEEFRRIWSK